MRVVLYQCICIQLFTRYLTYSIRMVRIVHTGKYTHTGKYSRVRREESIVIVAKQTARENQSYYIWEGQVRPQAPIMLFVKRLRFDCDLRVRESAVTFPGPHAYIYILHLVTCGKWQLHTKHALPYLQLYGYITYSYIEQHRHRNIGIYSFAIPCDATRRDAERILYTIRIRVKHRVNKKRAHLYCYSPNERPTSYQTSFDNKILHLYLSSRIFVLFEQGIRSSEICKHFEKGATLRSPDFQQVTNFEFFKLINRYWFIFDVFSSTKFNRFAEFFIITFSRFDKEVY